MGVEKIKNLPAWPELRTEAVERWLAGEDVEPITGYYNTETRKYYKPHNREEWEFIISDRPQWVLLRGGWRGGKTVAGIVKLLERLKRGCPCIMVSPDFKHFTRSLWMEFERWCPWELVELHHKTKQLIKFVRPHGWLLYGGIDEPPAWEGPISNYILFDEARRKKGNEAMKVLMSRASTPGPNGEPPQLVLTTTPQMNWLHEYFGPLMDNDPKAAFKAISKDYILKTEDNLENLDPGYVTSVSAGLSQVEVDVNLGAEWHELDNLRFLPTMSMWDLCEESLPPYTRTESMVLALDAAIGGSSKASSFGIVGVTRHPSRHDDIAVRYVQKWDAPPGGKIDFGAEEGPEPTIRKLCKQFNIVEVAYDPYQLHDMATRLNKEKVAWFNEFSQGAQRIESDRQLLDLIIQRRIAYKGQPDLRQHISNANRKLTDDGRRLRIVKREAGLNNDLAVCLSMSTFECLRLNL